MNIEPNAIENDCVRIVFESESNYEIHKGDFKKKIEDQVNDLLLEKKE